jgi:Co/Zn/Cd efflux system component
MNKPINLTQYRKALNIVFGIHIFMFIVSFTVAILSKSSSVFADSIDFIGDAAGYALSMYVLNKRQIVRASVSLAKSFTMMCFGTLVLVYALERYLAGDIPDPELMVVSGVLGIISHMICIYYLLPFSRGDSNQMSVWICTINDLLCNALTVIAAILVYYTNSIVPDLIAAFIIVTIALYGSFIILKQSLKEIKYYKLQNVKN